MKIYKTHFTRDDIEVEYRVKAEDEESARKKIFEICGERNFKIQEV